MTEAYYLIPMVAGPYSVTNKQRPDYMDEIRCNWTGYPVDALSVYVCKVNTTEVKHTDLASRAGVRQMPRQYTWDTVISTMPAAARTVISNWCTSKGIAYDSTDTIGQLLMRIIANGVFNLGNTTQTTQFQNMTQARQNAIIAICNRLGASTPTNTETARAILRRLGPLMWNGNGNDVNVEEY